MRAKELNLLGEVKSKPRILLIGCPITYKKLLNVIEDSEGIVIVMENCKGLKTVCDYKKDSMTSLIEYYVKIACPCMLPNRCRFELIEDIVLGYQIAGVVELTWHGCRAYNVEASRIKRYVNDRCHIPYIQIETYDTENDWGPVKVRYRLLGNC